MCVKLVNLQACRIIVDNFTNKRTPSQVFFDSILSPPHALPIHWLNPSSQILKSPPPHVLNTCGKSWAGGRDGGGGDDMNLGESFTWRQVWKILLENEFSGNLNITNCTIYPNYSDIYSFKRKLGKISGKG